MQSLAWGRPDTIANHGNEGIHTARPQKPGPLKGKAGKTTIGLWTSRPDHKKFPQLFLPVYQIVLCSQSSPRLRGFFDHGMAFPRKDHSSTFCRRNLLSLSTHGQSRGAGKDHKQRPVPTGPFLKGWTPELGPQLIWTVLLFKTKVWLLSNGEHLFPYPLPGEGVKAESGRTQWLSSLLWLLEGNHRATYSIGGGAAV